MTYLQSSAFIGGCFFSIVATAIGGVRGAFAAELIPPAIVDARRAAVAGVRSVDSRHLTLWTDVPAAPEVDALPRAFDASLPLLCKYFGVPRERVAAAKWQGALILDRQKFDALGMIPPERRDFINGYANGWSLWFVDQPSDYYRRHLLLHEGVHAFMITQLGGCGPGWYMEGMAELLATHRWEHRPGSPGRLRLGVFPRSREDVPMWGRIKLIRDATAAGRAWPIERVLAIDNSRIIPTEEYAWAWALCALLDGHPQFQERFRTLKGRAADSQFTRRFRQLFAEDWSDLVVEWQAFIATLDYGYEIERMAMVHRDAAPIREGSTQRVTIDADRGWQSTGWLLQEGKSYEISASGQYRIAVDPAGEKPWPCEPGGVTIEYHNGRPLGALLGALRPFGVARLESVKEVGASGIDADSTTTIPNSVRVARHPSFSQPTLIGLGSTLTPERDCVLYVRVNDSPAKLADNVGNLQIAVKVPAK